MPCVNCKKSILSQTPSLIGKAKCNSLCPEDIVCSEFEYAKCIFVEGKNDCITNGVTIQEQIDNIRSYVCSYLCSLPEWVNIFERPEANDLVKITYDRCKNKVEFQGEMTLDDFYSGNFIFQTKLNTIYRPFTTKRLLVLLTSLPSTNGCGVYYGHLYIDTDGSLRLEFDEEWLNNEYPNQGSLPYSPRLHFDNLSYYL